MEIEVSPPPGTKARPKPEPRQQPAPARLRRRADRHHARARSSASVATSRRNGSQPSRRRRQRDRRRPWNGRGRNAARGMSGTQDLVARSPRGRAGNPTKRRDMALAGICDLAARAALAAPVEGRPPRSPAPSSSPTISKYFSMNSARPCRMQTVPARRRLGGSQRAARRVTPSVVVTVEHDAGDRGGIGVVRVCDAASCKHVRSDRRGAARRRPSFIGRETGRFATHREALDTARGHSQLTHRAGHDGGTSDRSGPRGGPFSACRF